VVAIAVGVELLVIVAVDPISGSTDFGAEKFRPVRVYSVHFHLKRLKNNTFY
jgi:hypothetical protein